MTKEEKFDKLLAVVQAALLHDIGKLYEGTDPEENYLREIKREIPNLESELKYTHPRWTLAFWKKESAKLPFAHDFKLGSLPIDKIDNVSAYHHNPSTSWQRLIKEADCCSAGMDRTKIAPEENIKSSGKRRSTIPLITPWSRLKIVEFNKEKKPKTFIGLKMRYEMGILSPAKWFDSNGNILIQKNVSTEVNDLTIDYQLLKCEFEKLLLKISSLQLPTHIAIDALNSALEAVGWCVSSTVAKDDDPCISLYDHSKTTAAIAVCLTAYALKDDGKLDEKKFQGEAFRFCVIDLAGIQDYIYDYKETFKGLAKVLRGRSFYVSAVLEAVELSLLKHLGLSRICTLMDGGGKLTMLLPNLEGIEYEIDRFRHDLENDIVRNTHGRLRVIIGLGKSFSKDAFFYKPNPNKEEKHPLQIAYESAFINLDYWKKKPLRYSLQSDDGVHLNPEKVLINVEFDPEKKACKACGKAPGKVKVDEDWFCTQCHAHKEIGERLTRCQYYALVEKNAISPGSDLPVTEFKLRLEDDPKELRIGQSDKHFASVNYIWKEEIGFQPYRTRYIANYVPHWGSQDEIDEKEWNSEDKPEVGDVVSFEHLAERGIDVEGRGIRRLGVFKADVDNLGHIFNQIWNRPKAQITFMSSVSRLLNFFFGGILEYRLRNLKQNIYTVYAGGDDMFYIGCWREILEEASIWRKMFEEFTAHHSKVTYSAGISLAAPGIPINRLRDAAEEQLEKGKKCEGKNRISIWDKPICWNEDWEGFVLRWKDELDKWFKAGALNTAAAYRLLRYARIARRTKNLVPQLDDFLWHSRMRYDLARNFRESDNPLKQNIAEELWKFTQLDSDPEDNSELIEKFSKLFTIPLTWALYLNRGAGKVKE